MCGIICCGVCTKVKTSDGTPRGHSEPPDNIVCPYCTHKGPACYRRRVTYFTLFFIPLFPVHYSEYYMSCNSCGTMVGRTDCFLCRNCRAFAPQSFSHCVRCGIDLNEDGNRIRG